MQGEEILKEMQGWLNSASMPALVGAYRVYRETGTMGISGQPVSAVIDKRGILLPKRFEEYMLKLQSAVNTAVDTQTDMRPLPGDRTFELLQSTLEDMFHSTILPQDIARDFVNGKELGSQMRQYFAAIGVVHGRGGHGGRG